MAAAAFDTLKYARRLMAAGVPEKQAETQVELMAEAFVNNTEVPMTKGYLDARFAEQVAKINARFTAQDTRLDRRFAAMDVQFAEIKARFMVQDWLLGAIVACTVVPTLYALSNP
jgi:hypothetical protein